MLVAVRRLKLSGRRRIDWPGKGIGEIAGVDELRRQHLVQARPFPSNVRSRYVIKQVCELERVAIDVIKLVFDTAAV